jgi:hypothetical protein
MSRAVGDRQIEEANLADIAAHRSEQLIVEGSAARVGSHDASERDLQRIHDAHMIVDARGDALCQLKRDLFRILARLPVRLANLDDGEEHWRNRRRRNEHEKAKLNAQPAPRALPRGDRDWGGAIHRYRGRGFVAAHVTSTEPARERASLGAPHKPFAPSNMSVWLHGDGVDRRRRNHFVKGGLAR